jgi:hypothetical protein
MPRSAGATDKVQRRRQEKMETKKVNFKQKREKAKQKRQNAAKSSFFTPPPPSHNSPPDENQEEEDIADTDNVVYEELQLPILGGVVPAKEIIAELDEEQDEEDDNKDANFNIKIHGNTDDSSVMKTYLSSIQDRLRTEICSNTMNSKDKWLLELLKYDEWWIKTKRASKVCRKLGLEYSEKSYYRSVRVWFPELQYGQECMPSCLSCFSNYKVGVHAYSKKGPACGVVGLTTNYFVM